MRGLFVTGTDTGVGKTVLAASIVAALRERGISAGVLKPVITGLDKPPDADWPPDHELLGAVAGCEPDRVSPVRYGPAVSPHLAAQLARRPVRPAELRCAAVAAAEGTDALIVEGVGGLLVPLAVDYDVRCLARDLDLPLLIAARAGLGTINHTLLTIGAARAANLEIAAVVITPWPAHPIEMQRSNRETIERLGNVDVFTLPPGERADPEQLAAAADDLPLEQWLALTLR